MIILEEIINQVIAIDKEATKLISMIEEKEKNIDIYTEAELKNKQNKIEAEMKRILNEKQKDYDYELKKYSQKVTTKLNRDLKNMQENYEEQKELMLQHSYETIITQ